MDIFYPVTEDMPGVGVRVVVNWVGRQFRAARAWDKKAGALRWAAEQDGKLVWLPMRDWPKDCAAEPDSWRPERPELWQAPLPPPLLSTEPRMVDIRPRRNRYSAMAAQAEQSARAQAELVSEFGEIDDVPAVADKMWWLSEKLTYSPRGSISEREAEGRVARAILTDGIRSSYGGPRKHRETSSALSQFIHSALLSTDAEHMIERFDPTPRDLSDYDTAFGWFSDLNPPKRRLPSDPAWVINHEQRVLVWRITGSSWRGLASLAGGSHTGAKKVYGRILGAVTGIANREPLDRTADVRERNRRARVEG